MRTGNVKSVDYIADKDGDDVWQIITDAQNVDADGLNRCGIYVRHDGPKPTLGSVVTWSARKAWWDAVKVDKIGFEFDPNDPALYTG